MHKLIAKKKVVMGTKLIVLNAELVGLSEGCDPLQASFSLYRLSHLKFWEFE